MKYELCHFTSNSVHCFVTFIEWHSVTQLTRLKFSSSLCLWVSIIFPCYLRNLVLQKATTWAKAEFWPELVNSLMNFALQIETSWPSLGVASQFEKLTTWGFNARFIFLFYLRHLILSLETFTKQHLVLVRAGLSASQSTWWWSIAFISIWQ